MATSPISSSMIARQEECFARAFGRGKLAIARPLYHPDVVYVSPTVRLFGWPARIEGVDRTIEFIELTIKDLEDIRYRTVETAITAHGAGAFVRIHFDWTMENVRVRCNYVAIYRYLDSLIGRQELYYDPDGRLEVLAGE